MTSLILDSQSLPLVTSYSPLDVGRVMTRRGVLQAAFGAAAGATCLQAFAVTPEWGADVAAPPEGFWSKPRWVWLKRASTREEIRLQYWADGQLNLQAHQQISWFLRDRRFEDLLTVQSPILTSAVKRGALSPAHMTPWAMIDPIVIDILYAHCSWLHVYGMARPLHVTSGFRHVLTNSMTEGAARDSWHTRAGAADFVVPGVSIEQVARFGRWLAGGGVGLYPTKNFIHVDRGRVRSWAQS